MEDAENYVKLLLLKLLDNTYFFKTMHLLIEAFNYKMKRATFWFLKVSINITLWWHYV